jgi:oxygen-independent coproporphyrinogen-3 oxidase
MEKVRSTFEVSTDAEITLEANPDDIDTAKLLEWKVAGINRLSIGVQSFFEEDLRWMNRAHTASQAMESLQLAILEFPNITMDLIYGTPQLTNEKWKHNVDTAIALGIPHLSCYALTVEPKTPLDKMIRQQASPDVDPAKQSEQFLLLMDWLGKNGYEHYEISNFAKPGFRSRHNSSYWQGKSYYGFGPSAHSFDGNTRWWNIANNTNHIDSIENGIIPFEEEELTAIQKINERIMISLRTSEGLSLSLEVGSLAVGNLAVGSHPIAGDFYKVIEQILKKSEKYIANGLMIYKNDHLILTNEGKLLADGIASDLFLDE